MNEDLTCAVGMEALGDNADFWNYPSSSPSIFG